MSHAFKCPKCGSFNHIGQRFCGYCDEKFEYHCIECGVIVDITYTSCPNCKTSLSWSRQVSDTVPDTPSEALVSEKPSLNESQEGQPARKKTGTSFTLAFLVLLFILIIAGFYVITFLIGSEKTVTVDYFNKNAVWIDDIHYKMLIDEDALNILDNQLNTWVTWADGMKEKVQVDEDNFLVLDDNKKRLIGIVMDVYTPIEPNYDYWLPEQYNFLDKELSYLESINMRLVRLVIPYDLWSHKNKEEQMYALDKLLQLFYNHKMLVIASIHPKYLPGFNSLDVIDFDILEPDLETPIGDTKGQWMERTVQLLDEYDNVIAIGIDNELDFKLVPGMHWSSPDGHDYTVGRVEQHLAHMTDIVREKTNRPIVHNLMINRIEPEIKQACVDAVDIIGFDCYEPTPENLKVDIATVLNMLSIEDNWWCLEISYRDKNTKKWGGESDKFNAALIDAVFNSGATVAILYESNAPSPSEQAFFDNNGNPRPSLRNIAKEMERLQSTIE